MNAEQKTKIKALALKKLGQTEELVDKDLLREYIALITEAVKFGHIDLEQEGGE